MYHQTCQESTRSRLAKQCAAGRHIAPRLALLCLACLITLGLVSCGGPRVTSVQTSPSFTFTNAGSAAFMVGGVTTAVGDEEYRDMVRSVLPRELAVQIGQEREGPEVIDPQRAEQLLGQERYEKLLDAYEKSGSLDPVGRGELFEAAREQARYVTFARVIKDEISRTKTEDSVKISYTTSRSMAIEFLVFDATDGSLAWSGTISDSRSNTEEKEITGDTNTDCGLPALNCLVQILEVLNLFDSDDEDEFPLPPTFEKSAEFIFDEFAEQLPLAESG